MRTLSIILSAVLLVFAASAFAQQPVITIGRGVNFGNASGTIGATGTFQSLQAFNSQRRGCTIQNKGTNPMYVYFGPIGSATQATASMLAAGGTMYCNVQSLVTTDQVSITGTAADTFYATFE